MKRPCNVTEGNPTSEGQYGIAQGKGHTSEGQCNITEGNGQISDRTGLPRVIVKPMT